MEGGGEEETIWTQKKEKMTKQNKNNKNGWQKRKARYKATSGITIDRNSQLFVSCPELYFTQLPTPHPPGKLEGKQKPNQKKAISNQ